MSVTVRRDALPVARVPRFGGLLRRAARMTNPVMLGLAGTRWNPIFSRIEHVGRRTARRYAAPVAARRLNGGFVISLAFGQQVDWYRNLLAAGGGTIRWGGRLYPVAAPIRIDRVVGLAAFHPVQRLFLRLTGIDGFVWLADREQAW